MMGLSSMFLKTLAITPEGKCAKHPHVSVFATSSTAATGADDTGITETTVLKECGCCWKEQQDRKEQSAGELTLTTSCSQQTSQSADAQLPAALLQSAAPAATTTTVDESSDDNNHHYNDNKEWVKSVMMRWTQVMEAGGPDTIMMTAAAAAANTTNFGTSSARTTMTMGDESSQSHELMHDGSGSLNPMLFGRSGHSMMYDGSGSSNHMLFSSNHYSMATLAEESDRRTNSQSSDFLSTSSRHSSRYTNNSNHCRLARTGSPPPPATSQPWKRLEERIERQDASIQQLQATIQHQETSIRQDLQQLIQLVTTMANKQSQQRRWQEEETDLGHGMDEPVFARKSSTGLTARTPVISNTGPDDDATGRPQQEQGHEEGEDRPHPSPPPPKQRPALYNKNLQHPSNIFTSVRTLERKPPRPPMRHGSFSTHGSAKPLQSSSQQQSQSHRSSIATSSYIGTSKSIISSLGNSTCNDTNTYNDTTTSTNNDTSFTTPKTIANNNNNINNDDEFDVDLKAAYGPGLQSMLERERSRPLDIIFDASGLLSSGCLFENEDSQRRILITKDDKEEEEEEGMDAEEKKSGFPFAYSPKSEHSSGEGGGTRPPLIQKMRGSIRLDIPDDLQISNHKPTEQTKQDATNCPVVAGPQNNNKNNNDPYTLHPSSLPVKNSMPVAGRILRRPPSHFNHPENSGPHLRPRQPRREPSVTEGSTSPAKNNKSKARALPNRASNMTHPCKVTRYVPPPPPPFPHAVEEDQPAQQQRQQQHKPPYLARLDPRNLSKLGKNTAPPRREIFTIGGGSRQQISCLTIDTSLMTENEPKKTRWGDNSNVTNHYAAAPYEAYRDVINMALTDKFGDTGIYTGTLREEEIPVGDADDNEDTLTEQEEKQEIVFSAHHREGKKVVRIPHGTGTMKYDGGRFYKGEWRDGHWHGNGLLRNENGDSYEGEFVYDARHGRGIYRYENGDVYEGDFTEDKRHGKGTFMFHNGSVYRGDFVNGDFEGYGWYEFDDGYYEGEWMGGAYHGIGTLQYVDGGSYTGRFSQGKAHGLGEERDADGTTRRGVWKLGELCNNNQ